MWASASTVAAGTIFLNQAAGCVVQPGWREQAQLLDGLQTFLGQDLLMDANQIDTFLRRTTLRQIEVIAAMHEHTTMTAAAKALGMSVANVSRVTRRFEENTGLLIFSGNERRIAPSPGSREILQAFGPLAQEIVRLRALLHSDAIGPDTSGRGPRPGMR